MLTTSKRAAVVAVAGAVITPLIAQASSAGAGIPVGPALKWHRTLTKSFFVGPLQLAVNGRNIYVADSFQSLLRRGGGPTLAHGGNPAKGGDIAGVAVNTGNGDIAYTTTNADSHTYTTLTVLRHGKRIKVTNLARYERRNNPDKKVLYGMPDPAANKCAATALSKAFHTPARYPGQVDSHPYAVAYLGGGAYAVADAGGNDIVRVSKYGHPTRIAVLPKQKLVISAALAKENKLPKCTVGVTYYTEAVPTDVERGPDRNLYVTTLPGGPEGPSAGARGSVYKINPRAHRVTRIATGFVSPTNLAVRGNGAIYVAEPFANRVSTVVNGAPRPVFHARAVVAIEAANGRVYVTTAPALANVRAFGRVWELKNR